MEQDRSFSYTLILGTCVLLCLVLIGKMMLQHSPSASTPNTESSITQQLPADDTQKWTEAELAQLLTEKLSPLFPIHEVSVSIHADGGIRVSGSAEKETLQQYIQSSSIRSALILLPAQIPLQLDAIVQTQTTPPSLTEVSLQIGDLQLPSTALPENITQGCNQALAQLLTETEHPISDIQFEDGAIILRAPS